MVPCGMLPGRPMWGLHGVPWHQHGLPLWTGLEIGFYTGCVRMWRQLQARDPTIIPERAVKALAGLELLLTSIQLDPQAR